MRKRVVNEMITGSLSFPFPFSGATNFSRAFVFVFVAKYHFGGSFASLFRVTIESHSTLWHEMEINKM